MTDEKKLKNKWYYWGRWPTNTLFHSVWFKYTDTKLIKKYPIFNLSEFRELDGHYYLLKNDLNRISLFIEKKFKENQEWFNDYFEFCEKKVTELRSAYAHRVKLRVFLRILVETLVCSLVIEIIDYATQLYVKEKSNAPDKIFAMIKPSKKTPLMKFNDKLRKLNTGDLKKFVQEYEWVGTHGFAGEPLTEKKLREFLKAKKIKAKEARVEPYGGFKHVIRIASDLAYYRSYIVETADKISYSYWPDIKSLGEMRKTPWSKIIYATVDELSDFEKHKNINFGERMRGFGLINRKGRIYVITGKKLARKLKETAGEIDATLKEIKGQVASKGVARGVAKVIEDVSEIDKLKNNEILITNETTPAFILGMKRAAGIVTNIGGITSHAAIISRELKKPCIIGTKIASKVLKDGDLVEVDATKGIVKILKRK